MGVPPEPGHLPSPIPAALKGLTPHAGMQGPGPGGEPGSAQAGKQNQNARGCFLPPTQVPSQPLGVWRGVGGSEFNCMGCVTALTSSQAGPRTQPSHSPGPRAQEARALPPPGCSLSHEQDSQVTGQGCQAASKAGLLQELGPGSFLCGGRWGSGSGLLSLAPAQLLPPHTPPGSGAHTVMSPRK